MPPVVGAVRPRLRGHGRFARSHAAEDACPVLVVGTVLPGGFVVDGHLGSGSLADVFAVTSPSGQPLAVKMLHENLSADPALVARFGTEADLLASVKHPSVVAYRTRGVWGRRPFLVMDRALGRDLASELTRNGALALDRAIRIGCGVLEGLAALHARAIVHRDIKPANVFVSEQGDLVAVQLIDLGSAARIGGESQGPFDIDDRLTPTGHTMATPHYASPEVLTGLWVRDQRGDLYATAILLFQMITGHLPFDHRDVAELIRRIVNTPAPPLSVFGFPRSDASDLVERALHTDPGQRFDDALSMRDALQACLDTRRDDQGPGHAPDPR